MRHRKKTKKLGRTAAHRKATLAALSNALITHKRITTTFVKAKALRTFVEPLLTRARADSTHNRRMVFRKLQDKTTVTELFNDVGTQIGERAGGYTRIVKLGQRQGDAAEMAIIELVDYNDVQPDGTGGKKKKTRRTRRGSTRSKTATPKPAAKATVAPEVAVEEIEAAAEEAIEEVEAEAEAAVEEIEAAAEEAKAEVEAPEAVEEIEAAAEEAIEEVEVAAEEAVEEIEAAAEEAVEEVKDDLTKLWGIGPVFAGLLNDHGIATFAQLAGTDLEALRTIINESGVTAAQANEETWAEQARYAAEGNWDALDTMIDQLKAD